MKKLLIILSICIFALNTVYAESFPDVRYKNIKNKDKITYNYSTRSWTNNINRELKNYYIKTKGFGDFYDYVDVNGNFMFTTDCEYEFLYNGKLIGYSNKDLKFYDIRPDNSRLTKIPLSKEEVQSIFPEYKVIGLSEFSKNTNSLKIKKHFKDLKIILINDTGKALEKYNFSSGNVKYTKYSLRSFITIKSSGMVQFTSENSYSSGLPLYILLVR